MTLDPLGRPLSSLKFLTFGLATEEKMEACFNQVCLLGMPIDEMLCIIYAFYSIDFSSNSFDFSSQNYEMVSQNCISLIS